MPRAHTNVSPTTVDSFGGMLKYLRRHARLTQRELAIAVGYSEAQISRLEQNQRLPDLTTLAALFVPVLAVENQPEIVAQMLELAAAARGELLAGRSVSQTTTRTHIHSEEFGSLEAIPPAPQHAVERPQAVARLCELLASERRVALCGLGGMGKTTLAATVARHYAQHSPVLWLTLTSGVTTTVEALLRQLALFVLAHGHEQVLPLLQSGDQPTRSLDQHLALLGTALTQQDALVCLDNAQLVQHDPAIIQVVSHLIATTPTRLLLTTRVDVSIPGLSHVRLAGFDRAEGRALIEQLWPPTQPPLAPALADRVLEKTAGSPMLVRLALGHARTSNDLDGFVTHLETQPQVAGYLLDTVLGQLSAPARQLAALVAVFRQPVDLYDETLVELSQAADGPYDLAVALTDLQRCYLIDHPAHAALHPLIQDHLYATLVADLPRRKRLHTIAAQFLERAGDLAEAAYQYAHAGALDQAVDMLADQGAALFSRGQAAQSVVIVDDILRRVAQRRGDAVDLRRRLLLVRGDLLISTTRSNEAEANYREALAVVDQPAVRAQIVSRLAYSLLQRGAVAEALQLCQETAALLAPSDTLLRGQLAAATSQALMMLSRYDEAVVAANSTLALVEQLAPLALPAVYMLQSRAHATLGTTARMHRRFADAQHHFERALVAAQHGHSRQLENRCRFNLANLLYEQAQFDAALALHSEVLQVARELGDEYTMVRVLHTTAAIHYNRGELLAAQSLLAEACDRKQRLGDMQSLATSQNTYAEVLLLLGHVAAGRALAEQMVAATEQTGELWLRAGYLETLGFAQVLDGDAVLAEATLQGALELPCVATDARLHGLITIQRAQALIAQQAFDAAQHLLAAVTVSEAEPEVALKRQLACGMLALAHGDCTHAAALANAVAAQAEATGLRVYRPPAQRLLAATHNPPPPATLLQVVWLPN